MRSRHGLLVPLLLSGAVLLPGCQAPPPPQPPTTVRIGIALPANLTVLRELLTNEPVLRVGMDGRYEPALAERWAIDKTGLVLSLDLKEGVTFHDGHLLDGTTVKEILDALRGRAETLQAHPTLGDIVRIDVPRQNSVDIHFDRPVGVQLDGLTALLERQVDGRPVGTGPFALQTEAPDGFVLTAHHAFHGGEPTVDVIQAKTYPTLRAAWAAMMRGEHDFLYEVPIAAREFVEAESTVALFRSNRPYALMIGLNPSRDVLKQPEVRKALNHAVDRQSVVERALIGDGAPASGLWPMHWVYDGIDRVYRFDPTLADHLLTSAGHPSTRATSSDGRRPPARVRFTCLVFDGLSVHERVATIVQRQLYDVGVDMEIVAMDPQQMRRRLVSGDYDAALVPQNTGLVLSRLYSFWHSGQPQALFRYTAADNALEALRNARETDELAEAARSVQTTFYDNPPGIFLANLTQARAVSRRFSVRVEPGRDISETIWQWVTEEDTSMVSSRLPALN